MAPNNPLAASGIGGRTATAKDIGMMTNLTCNYFAGRTNALAANTHYTNTYNASSYNSKNTDKAASTFNETGT